MSPSPSIYWHNLLPAFFYIELETNVSVFVSVIPELAQCQGAASLWQQCVGPGSVYSVSAQSFMATLSSLYSTMMTERADVTAETGTTSALSSQFMCHVIY